METCFKILQLNVAPLRGEHGSVAASIVFKTLHLINVGAG